MFVVMLEVDEGELLFFEGVCQVGSGGGLIVSDVCQVFLAVFSKVIVVFSLPVVRIRNGPFLALVSST